MMASLNNNFTIVSFNARGTNQGDIVLNQLCNDLMPCVIFIQEHWLSSVNSDILLNFSVHYVCFFSSSMDKIVSTGILRGRPFGGVAIMIRNDLVTRASLVAKSDRMIIVLLGDILLVNIYASSANCTDEKTLINTDLLSVIDEALENFNADYRLVIGGDFNTDLRNQCKTTSLFKNFFPATQLVH